VFSHPHYAIQMLFMLSWCIYSDCVTVKVKYGTVTLKDVKTSLVSDHQCHQYTDILDTIIYKFEFGVWQMIVCENTLVYLLLSSPYFFQY